MDNQRKQPEAEATFPRLRSGYTTGSCGAAAAKAAMCMLMGENGEVVSITTPGGKQLTLKTENITTGEDWCSCAVRKDSGDDPDVTNGVLVYAKVSLLNDPGIVILGGQGIGRVTKPGLACPVGEAAINPTPRKMITQAVEELCTRKGWRGGVQIELSIPKGETLAARTYNPRLGIIGGLSILGTTGIVEPMSEKALIDSILVEIRVFRKSGESILLVTPGNYGEEFARDTLGLDPERTVKCSNYIGETLAGAEAQGFEGILFIGHAGKLIKLAAGIMNTHSRQGDGRGEILTAHAALAGASKETCRRLMESVTVDQALEILEESNLRKEVISSILDKISWHLNARKGAIKRCGAVLFTNRWGLLGFAGCAKELLGEAGSHSLSS